MSTPQPPRFQDLHIPVELTRPAETPPRQRRWLLLALLGLIACLAELAWITQDNWLASPGVRAVLTPVVARTGHTLRRPILADAWSVDGLALTADPAVDGVWQVDAVLTQHADILQPWPRLRLVMRDWQGASVAERDLMPADYLPAGLPPRFAANRLIAADQAVRIHVSVRQPARANGTRPSFEQVALRPLP